MKLHQNKDLFKDAIVATSQQMGIREIYLEKDYWVTLVLYYIFKGEMAKEVVFKGGTALSKCFGLIQRFSEDIDLVVLRNKDETGNQLKNKVKKISQSFLPILPEVKMEGITKKFGKIRKTAHVYPQAFSGHFGQVRDVIIVESMWLGSFEPFTTASIHSYIYEMLLNNNQQSLIDEYGMNPFSVQVLSPKRTLCEKIMSLVRFSHSQEPIIDLQNKIRHIYDIHMLLKDEKISAFFHSMVFESMMLRVGTDDIENFKNNNLWLVSHPAKALIFSKTVDTWNKIKSTYTGNFKELVIDKLPPETEVLKTLNIVGQRLHSIKWGIRL